MNRKDLTLGYFRTIWNNLLAVRIMGGAALMLFGVVILVVSLMVVTSSEGAIIFW